MKKLTNMLGFIGALFLCNAAEAAPQVRIQMKIQSAENQQQLFKLMLQNSLRIYQQRLRFWQRAMEQQAQKAGDPDKAGVEQRHRYRHRHRNQTRLSHGQPRPTAPGPAAAQPSKAGEPQQASKMAGLKKLLRSKRLKQASALDRKLKKQLRKRTRTEAGSGYQHRHEHRRGISRPGGRRGR